MKQARIDSGGGSEAEPTTTEREVFGIFATLKAELTYRRPWPCQKEARPAIHEYIGGFYNGSRRHSFLGNQSPVQYERMFNQEAALAA